MNQESVQKYNKRRHNQWNQIEILNVNRVCMYVGDICLGTRLERVISKSYLFV